MPPAEKYPVHELDYQKMSVEEYLLSELENSVRHEYSCGQVRAMAGASALHNLACGTLYSTLLQGLSGTGCTPFMENLKLYIEVAGEENFFYPDVMVSCDPQDNHPHYRYAPKFLCEVLSKDVKKDKIERYLLYKSIDSLEEYLILDPNPENPSATLYARKEDWVNPLILTSGSLHIKSLDISVDLDALYAALREVKQLEDNG